MANKAQENGVLSVSAAMAQAKTALESFTVKLVGEVSELNNKPGYKAVYFTVKDDAASLPCMMWLNRYNASGVEMRVGMLLEITGRFTLYAPKGRMNFDAFSIAVAGQGNLRLEVANRAKRLQAEGLMAQERKRTIPRFSKRIGLVTSPRGAAVHDVLRTLRRRFPLAEVCVAGVAVEGEGAAAGLIEALRCVESAQCEIVLLVRGGGSFEDLMPFNDEALARCIAGLSCPVVTGIGHEPDTSIADMVADLRASTPTAAAEAVTPSPEELSGYFTRHSEKLSLLINGIIEKVSLAVDRFGERPIFTDPNTLFAQESLSLDMYEERLRRAIPTSLEKDAQKLSLMQSRLLSVGRILPKRFETSLSVAASRLHDLSPLTVLSRGYAIARDDSGKVIKSAQSVSSGDSIVVDLHEGKLFCRVNEKEETQIVSLEENV